MGSNVRGTANAEPRAVASGCYTQFARFLEEFLGLRASIRSLPRAVLYLSLHTTIHTEFTIVQRFHGLLDRGQRSVRIARTNEVFCRRFRELDRPPGVYGTADGRPGRYNSGIECFTSFRAAM